MTEGDGNATEPKQLPFLSIGRGRNVSSRLADSLEHTCEAVAVEGAGGAFMALAIERAVHTRGSVPELPVTHTMDCIPPRRRRPPRTTS